MQNTAMFETQVAMSVVNGEVQYETVKLEVFENKLVWYIGQHIVETIHGQIPRMLLNKTLSEDILNFHRETVLKALKLGQIYNIVYYPTGGLVPELQQGVYSDHQNATLLAREKFFFRHGGATCGVVINEEIYRIQLIGDVKYYAIFDNETGDYIETGYNETSKDSLAKAIRDYIKNGMEDEDITILDNMDAESVIDHFETMGFSVEVQNVPFADRDFDDIFDFED